MATVVITFFLFVRINVCKMDADCIERDQLLSRREKRWSMNSQRLEEIVAELMKPVSDARRTFDTDLSALLEEYLTEAGLRALDAGEDSSAEDVVSPNFPELALLLQQSANIYGRKVDYLYQHVLDVSDSLQNCTQDLDNSIGSEQAAASGGEGAAGEGAGAAALRRRRRASSAGAGGAGAGAGGWGHVVLQPCPTSRREAGRVRPPPTLPRMFLELEPRVLTAADAPLLDYAGEPIGLLSDFQLTWRLHDGLLVDDLEVGVSGTERALQPISLVELQAAISAAVAPLSPARSVSGPLRASTPLADAPDSPDPPDVPDTPATPDITFPSDTLDHLRDPTPAPVVLKKERKRKSISKIDNIIQERLNIAIGEDLRLKLREVRDFSILPRWIKRVVEKRKRHILSERRRLRAQESNVQREFAGWSGTEAAAATAAAKDESRAAEPLSDDDGFFEQSSGGDSDASRVDDAAGAGPSHQPAPGPSEPGPSGDEPGWAAWQAGVLARAGRPEALDVRGLGARVLAALAGARRPALPFPALLRREARDHGDVSRLLLATLFLANSGNVEVIPGQPLSVNSFSLRLVSTDERLYSAAAAAEEALPR